jgi:hypothetical protein
MDVRAKQLRCYSRFLLNFGGLGGGFAPRHLKRSTLLGENGRKDKKMKILLTLLLLFFVGCQSITTTNKPVVSSDTDVENLTNAKLIIYNSNATQPDLQKAEGLLKAIPTNSSEYKEAQSLLTSLERKKNGDSAFESTTKSNAPNNTPVPESNRPAGTDPQNSPCYRACGARFSADQLAPQCSHVTPASAYRRCIDRAVDSVVDLCLKECGFK